MLKPPLSMFVKLPHIICTALLSLLLLHDLSAQSSSARWALSIGGAGSRYNGTTSQALPRAADFFPSGKISATRYLRPGFNFRTQVEFSPAVLDPLSSENIFSQYFSFQYAFIVKLNNGIILKEDARIAPYAYLGAGGSYHATRPDAYSPFGAGISVRLGERSALQLEVNRNISWNKSPQVLSAGVNYVYFLNTKSPQVAPIEVDEAATQDIIASQRPADSDGDGVADSEDQCPYDAGFIQNNGCPEDSVSDLETELAVVASRPEPDTTIIIESEPVNKEESVEGRISAALEEEGLIFSPEPSADTSSTNLPFEPVTQEPILVTAEEMVETEEKPYAEPCSGPGEVSITFERGSSDLSDEDKEKLNELAISLKECPAISLSLIGYADDGRTEDSNLVLSIKRAFNVKYYLVYEHGISQRRIFSKGAGSENENRSPRSVSFSWSS